MIRAAQYLRVSTKSQAHSLPQQAAEIADYAARHGYMIVRNYSDEGRSGVRLRGRAAMKQLLTDVFTANRDFDAVLVQDISRWGRFPDTDESAHYEYICRSAGVKVVYCHDALEDKSMKAQAIFKAMKRVMAAEFSRSLSIKIRDAQCRMAQAGYKMGGPPGYALRRAVVGADGALTPLKPGEHREQGARIVLVHGPQHEVETVRRIFRLYLEENMQKRAIAELLNADGCADECRRFWNECKVARVLKQPRYGGDYIFHRTECAFGEARRRTPRGQWIIARNAVPPIVPRAWLAAVARRLPNAVWTDKDEAWNCLRKLHQIKGGPLRPRDIDHTAGLPHHATFSRYFGGWARINARLDACAPPHFRARRYRSVALAVYDKHDWRSVVSAPLAISGDRACSAFSDDCLLVRGSLSDVVGALAHIGDLSRLLTFDDATGRAFAANTSVEVRRLQRGLARPASAETEEPDVDRRAAYRTLYALGGHRPGYHQALEALFSCDIESFKKATAGWPSDVHAYSLAQASRACAAQSAQTTRRP
jgi:DNA invertase Pin-like site-specific DNA recombinase